MASGYFDSTTDSRAVMKHMLSLYEEPQKDFSIFGLTVKSNVGLKLENMNANQTQTDIVIQLGKGKRIKKTMSGPHSMRLVLDNGAHQIDVTSELKLSYTYSGGELTLNGYHTEEL